MCLFVCLFSVCTQVSGETAPAPTRGPNVRSADEEAEEESGGGGGGGAAAAPVSLADLMPKVDISGQIKSDLIKELGDKGWKIRGEALQKVSAETSPLFTVLLLSLTCVYFSLRCKVSLQQLNSSSHRWVIFLEL